MTDASGEQLLPDARPPSRVSQRLRTGQNVRRTCISSEPSGYFSQVHCLITLEQPAACCLLRNFITRFPVSSPITAGEASAKFASILSCGICLAKVRHSDGTLSKNSRLVHTAWAKASGSGFFLTTFTNSDFDTAGFGSWILSPERARPRAACTAALVFHSGPCHDLAPRIHLKSSPSRNVCCQSQNCLF